ncbi:reverse transcriptase family protein [Bacillus anthracis]|uniref:reverse transcriptase family protein n=1 Tax=Bacillus anthracis TaxID=1392 RepID=UPI002DD73216|nr:reverse transcriptase family protein [Bacillus anthracis]
MRKYSFNFEVIIIFIYKEDFFYDYVLRDSLEEVSKQIKNKQDSYYTVKIPKKGGVRVLNCIKQDTSLFELQTSLKVNFLDKIPIAENVYGFVKEQSYKDFLVPHVWDNGKKRYYLRVDIKDFFGSITNETLIKVFDYYFKTSDKVSKELNELLMQIISLNGVLPQGAVTSPVVSNIVFRKLDIRIKKYCDKFGIIYSRYADDLLFSSSSIRLHDKFFIKKINHMLKSLNFNINTKKIKKTESEISLNGFVVGKNVRISRSKKRDLNRVLFIYEDQKPKNMNDFLTLLNNNKFKSRVKNNHNKYFEDKINLLNYLNGYRSFLIGWLHNNTLSVEYDNQKQYIERLEEFILNVNRMN